MARVVHFVVAVDLDKKTTFIDDDTFTAVFADGALYDEEKEEWRAEDYDTEYLPALEILNTVPLSKE
jgi:hypothetical protein